MFPHLKLMVKMMTMCIVMNTNGSNSDSDDNDMSNASDNRPEYFSPASFPDIQSNNIVQCEMSSGEQRETSSGEQSGTSSGEQSGTASAWWGVIW